MRIIVATVAISRARRMNCGSVLNSTIFGTALKYRLQPARVPLDRRSPLALRQSPQHVVVLLTYVRRDCNSPLEQRPTY
jgi:hypothetical protein